MIKSLKGLKTILTEVTPEDAQLIIKVRNNPKINKFLSSTEKLTLKSQIEWIINNRLRDDNFYFKITDLTGKFYGTISLYNIRAGSAEFGRYISLNPIHAVEAEYLILKFGFESAGLDKIYCRTVLGNIAVWNQHYKFGFIDEEVTESDETSNTMKKQQIDRIRFSRFDYRPMLKLVSRF